MLYKEYRKNGKVLKIYFDVNAQNPREWDNLGTMVCFHRKYHLGDPHNYNDPWDFLLDLLEEHFGDYSQAENFIKSATNYDEIIEYLKQDYVILPLYLYDHGDITISTSPFSCPWDSGQVGWIYCSKERFRKETGFNEDELFSTDSRRPIKIGDHVKVDGRGYGKVIDICNEIVTIDFDYNKIPSAKMQENIVTVPAENCSVMCNQSVELLKAEVDIYDQYLRGDVYGYVSGYIEKCPCCGNEKFVASDSCWGFYGTDFASNGLLYYAGEEWEDVLT